MRIAAKRSLITETGAEERGREDATERGRAAGVRSRASACVRVCEGEKVRARARDEKDKGKTDGTIDPCVKSAPSSFSSPLFIRKIIKVTKTERKTERG